MKLQSKFLAGLLGLFATLTFYSQDSFANTLQKGYERKPTDDTYWCDPRQYTPRERIRANMIKGELYPPLKGRWDDAYYELSTSYREPGDDIAQVIFAQFMTDQELAKIPAHLKVKARGGDVTLEGFVRNEREKALIGEKVSRLRGVSSLQNNIQIRMDGPSFVG
jgi:hypothetical protein